MQHRMRKTHRRLSAPVSLIFSQLLAKLSGRLRAVFFGRAALPPSHAALALYVTQRSAVLASTQFHWHATARPRVCDG